MPPGLVLIALIVLVLPVGLAKELDNLACASAAVAAAFAAFSALSADVLIVLGAAEAEAAVEADLSVVGEGLKSLAPTLKVKGLTLLSPGVPPPTGAENFPPAVLKGELLEKLPKMDPPLPAVLVVLAAPVEATGALVLAAGV